MSITQPDCFRHVLFAFRFVRVNHFVLIGQCFPSRIVFVLDGAIPNPPRSRSGDAGRARPSVAARLDRLPVDYHTNTGFVCEVPVIHMKTLKEFGLNTRNGGKHRVGGKGLLELKGVLVDMSRVDMPTTAASCLRDAAL